MTMTLAQVAWKLGELAREGAVRYDAHDMAVMFSQMADAVTAHLSQPHPVAQGEAVGVLSIDNFRDCRSMQNVQFDYTGDLPVGTHKLYATPNIPTGRRLVPIEPTDKMTYVGQSLRYDSAISIGEIYRQMLAAAPDAGGV